MTAPVAPPNAHLVIAILETAGGLQPVAFLTEMVGTEAEISGEAIAGWRSVSGPRGGHPARNPRQAPGLAAPDTR